MIEGKFLSGEDDLTEAFEIRRQVFQIEQKVDPKLEFDEYDKSAVHVVIHTRDKAVATGRIIKKDNTYKIGRIAVLQEERGKKYGDFVVRMLIDKAFQSGAEEVMVGSQIQAVGFYRKIGFEVYGEEYVEAGINHIAMKLKKEALCKECRKEMKQ